MPVDVHPEEGIPGVELILTRLHAGGKFSQGTYRFSGGLHGVGVSVVNALSRRLEVRVKRGGSEYAMAFEGGEKVAELAVAGPAGRRNTGTAIRFWPDPRYFDSPKFSVPRLLHTLRAKAVLCPGLRVSFEDEATGEQAEWYYEDGLSDYLRDALGDAGTIPETPFVGALEGNTEGVDWAVVWLPEGGEGPAESYVNLIPTTLGGTHVNGFRTGLLEAVREYCEFRSLLPRGVKLAPEDVWEHCRYVLSVKMSEPQFTGQTKDRLSSRECAAFVSGVVKDAFSLWLGQHPDAGDRIAEIAIAAPRPVCAPRSGWCARRSRPAQPCPASSPTAPPRTSRAPSSSWSRAIPPGARPSRPATASSRRSCRCGARSSTPGRWSLRRCSPRRRCTTSPSPSGSIPVRRSGRAALRQGVHPR